MFGIGFTEIILIVVLALVVLGPDKLPQLGKTLARFLGEFNKVKREFKMTISDIERAGEAATERDAEAKGDASGSSDDADEADDDESDLPDLLDSGGEIYDMTFESESDDRPLPNSLRPVATPEGSREAAGVGRKPAAKPTRPARRRAATTVRKPRASSAKPKLKTETETETKTTTEAVKKTTVRRSSQRRTPRRRISARAVVKPQDKAANINGLVDGGATQADHREGRNAGEGGDVAAPTLEPTSKPASKPVSNPTPNSNKGEA